MLQYIPFVDKAISKIFGNKEKREKYAADERAAVYSQFAAEFGHSKTWWDSFIDGVNRLPRPLMTFGIIFMFVYCWVNPLGFINGATALQAMPKEGWYILGIVVSFWFAGKLPKDFGKLNYGGDIAKIKKNLSARSKGSGNSDQEDPQEGIDWKNKVKKRYKTDWDNLND